jgi:hypothetical protein
MHTHYTMINSKIVLVSFVAFAMLAMAATTIVTQEVYAKHHAQPKILDLVHVPYDTRAYCGTNWQGNFHLSLGNASLSVPAGMCFPDYGATMGPAT